MVKEIIDFVILWVDGSDKEWQKEKNKYLKSKNLNSNGEIRFRDWDNLKYWFRGVEKFAPWVNKIYFVTWGHLPQWLDTSNPKLVIVNHKDYIDNDYLPTFNSNVLDLNLKNIRGLNENFVYFNDDTFLLSKVKPNDFFEKNLPKDEYVESSIVPTDNVFSHNLVNNLLVINDIYDKKKERKKNILKHYNFKYGLKNNLKTLSCSFYNNYTGFYNPHLAQSFLKSDFEKLWSKNRELCVQTSLNKFRTVFDITQYLIRYMRLIDGSFVPRSYKFGRYFEIGVDNFELLKCIKKQKYKLICINDVSLNYNFEVVQKQINKAFEQILPEKCSFEK